MDAQYTLELKTGTLTVYPGADCAVSIVGQDGLIATVVTGNGELRVHLDQDTKRIWTHTFTYAPHGVHEHTHDQADHPSTDPALLNHIPPTPMQRRGRGRPQGSARVPKPSMMNLDGELVQPSR